MAGPTPMSKWWWLATLVITLLIVWIMGEAQDYHSRRMITGNWWLDALIGVAVGWGFLWLAEWLWWSKHD